MTSDAIEVNGLSYVASRRAAEISGYAQDYIGQLARSGQIDAKRIGGLWYVLMESLNSYKSKPDNQAEQVADEGKKGEQESDVLVSFDGKNYISANRASKITGYNQDYVGQLARSGKVLARQVGNRWYIDRDGILAHKEEKDSLLAAVQAAAVGLNQITPPAEKIEPVLTTDDLPLLQYNSDSSDLTPILQKTDGIRVHYESERHNQHLAPQEAIYRPELQSKSPDSYDISPQDHKIHHRTYNKQPQSREKRNSRANPARRYVVGTITVGIACLAFLLLVRVTGLGFPMTNQMVQLANSSSAVSGVMDSFEKFVSPELQFNR